MGVYEGVALLLGVVGVVGVQVGGSVQGRLKLLPEARVQLQRYRRWVLMKLGGGGERRLAGEVREGVDRGRRGCREVG